MIFYLALHSCPCYCGGEGLLLLVSCPQCGSVMARCDEVDELIRDVHAPQYVGEESICYPDQLCPRCGRARYGDFDPADEAGIRASGLREGEYREWLR